MKFGVNQKATRRYWTQARQSIIYVMCKEGGGCSLCTQV